MGLKENLAVEPVSALRLREAVTVPPSTLVREAIQKMRGKQLGCVVVVDDDGKPVGVFSEQRILQLLLSAPDALESQTVEQHLDPAWATVRLTEPVAAVVKVMQARDLRFVVVLDAAGKAVALTGQKGLMEYIAEHFPQQVMVQQVGGHRYFSEAEGA